MDIGKIGDPCFPIIERLYPLEFIELRLEDRAELSDEFAEAYEKGHSIAEIAKLHGCSKHKVKSLLEKHGITLRERLAQPTLLRRITSGKQGVRPYFGFCYLEGRIIKDPKEFPTLAIIHKRWSQKRSIHVIVKELNEKKIKSREGREWSWAAIQNIVKRFDTGQVVLVNRTFHFNPSSSTKSKNPRK